MRVLFYLGDKQWSGCARAMLAAARGLNARGHPIIVAGCEGGRLGERAQEAGLDVVTINTAVTSRGGVAWDSGIRCWRIHSGMAIATPR